MKGSQEGARASVRHTISPYHHGIWLICFLNVATKKNTRARARKGEVQGVLSDQKSKRNF